jgi:hypothetical protein
VVEVAKKTANEDKKGSSTSITQKRYKSFITEGHYAQESKHRTGSGRSWKLSRNCSILIHAKRLFSIVTFLHFHISIT